MKKKICIVTGSRAEYGQLRPLLQQLSHELRFEIQLLVTGMHLSPEFGLTYQEIEQDGFVINEKVEMLLSSDSVQGVSKSMGLALIGLTDAYQRLMPDMVILTGDRYEMLAAAIAAHIGHIPIAHIAGGETTQGAVDEAFRHSITKMSAIHFTATEVYRKRIIQLGEAPEWVYNVGGLAIDGLMELPFLSKNELEQAFNCQFNQRNLLVTYHPATLEGQSSRESVLKLLEALSRLDHTSVFFTKANVDAAGREINELIEDYVGRNSSKAWLFANMGRLRYLSMMRLVDGVVGNSSSGIVEAPSFKIGTVNIGDRQKGRTKASSVIDCKPETEDITRALNTLYETSFRQQLSTVVNSYGDGHATEKILSVLTNLNFRALPVGKPFFDVEFSL